MIIIRMATTWLKITAEWHTRNWIHISICIFGSVIVFFSFSILFRFLSLFRRIFLGKIGNVVLQLFAISKVIHSNTYFPSIFLRFLHSNIMDCVIIYCRQSTANNAIREREYWILCARANQRCHLILYYISKGLLRNFRFRWHYCECCRKAHNYTISWKHSKNDGYSKWNCSIELANMKSPQGKNKLWLFAHISIDICLCIVIFHCLYRWCCFLFLFSPLFAIWSFCEFLSLCVIFPTIL